MSDITRIPITDDRDAWLAERRKDVTGSEIGALFGVHRYLTPAQLYAEKIGALPDDKQLTGPLVRGVKLESFVAEEIGRRHPEWQVYKATNYYRDKKHRVGGTPDYLVNCGPITNRNPHRVLEIKTVGASDFLNIWRGGDPEGEICPEPWQIMQCLTYQHLTGWQGGIIAVMVVGEWAPLEIHEIQVPRNDKLIDRMLNRVGDFWEAVDGGHVPEFDYSRDMATIKALYASAIPGTNLDLTWDTELPILLHEREGLKTREREAKRELEEVEARIRAKIGDAESVTAAGGWEITLKNQHRAGYTVAPCDFRVLRAKRKG